MTKSKQIMGLNDGTRTNKEIAALVGCLPAYVRVVLGQRRGSVSESDRRYRVANIDKLRASDALRKRRYIERRKQAMAAQQEGGRAAQAERSEAVT